MRISIIGAYGYTGKLICATLEQHGFSFSIAGRNEEKLNELANNLTNVESIFPVDLRKLETTQELLKATDLIVNCAGPFTEESFLFLEEIAIRGKRYMDISGEVGFVKDSKNAYHDCSVHSNSLLFHGAAFESMLVDLAIQTLQPKSQLKVYYQFNQKRVSPGTRITMKLAKHRTSWGIENGDWKEMTIANGMHAVSFDRDYAAVPYPLPEIAFAHWNYDTYSVNTYLLLEKEEAKYVSTESKPESELLPTLERLRVRKKDGPSAADRNNHKCQIYIVCDGETWLMESNDMYQTTAECILLLVEQLKAGTDLTGVRSPAENFVGKERETLDQLNVTFEKIED